MDPPLDYANPQTWEGFSLPGLRPAVSGSFQASRRAGEARPARLRRFGSLSSACSRSWRCRLPDAPRPALAAALLLAWFVVTWWFSLTYINADIERYYLGPLAVAVLGGLGAAGPDRPGAALDPRPIGWRPAPPACAAAA
jgi:hypothetical protein